MTRNRFASCPLSSVHQLVNGQQDRRHGGILYRRLDREVPDRRPTAARPVSATGSSATRTPRRNLCSALHRDTIVSNGAVSEETVIEMAEGALRVSGADLSVAVSGIAGPGGGTDDKPVGPIWFAFSVRDGRCAGRYRRRSRAIRRRPRGSYAGRPWPTRFWVSPRGPPDVDEAIVLRAMARRPAAGFAAQCDQPGRQAGRGFGGLPRQLARDARLHRRFRGSRRPGTCRRRPVASFSSRFRLRFDRCEFWPRPRVAVLAAQTVPPALEHLVESLNLVLKDLGRGGGRAPLPAAYHRRAARKAVRDSASGAGRGGRMAGIRAHRVRSDPGTALIPSAETVTSAH